MHLFYVWSWSKQSISQAKRKDCKGDDILFVVEYERLQKVSHSRHPAHQKKVNPHFNTDIWEQLYRYKLFTHVFTKDVVRHLLDQLFHH